MFTSTSLSRDYIIFSPDFAKAFFKEVLYEEDSQATYNPNALAGKGTPDPTTFKLVKNDWKDRQHKMLDEVQEGRNPLQYLSEFLEEKWPRKRITPITNTNFMRPTTLKRTTWGTYIQQ